MKSHCHVKGWALPALVKTHFETEAKDNNSEIAKIFHLPSMHV